LLHTTSHESHLILFRDTVAGPSSPQVATLALQHDRSRILTELRSSNSGLLLLAVLVGLGAGGGAIVFRWLIKTFTLLLSGHSDYSLAGHAAHPSLPGLGRWFVIGAPVVAGLLYGPLVHFLAREARGHGVPEVMFAVARSGGRIKPQVAAVKALASALCIGKSVPQPDNPLYSS
jgi:CIC family chloride channel protein